MKDRLSPNIAPPTTAASVMAMDPGRLASSPTAMGARATIVPTEVPRDVEMKQATTKSPATMTCGGMYDSAKPMVDDMPPMALLTSPNAPASRKMRIMTSRFSSPAPLANRRSFVARDCFGNCKNATNSASTNTTSTGMA